MKWWNKFKKNFENWVKRNIIDSLPPEMDDEFSEKYRK
jgi:hypothetical protein